MLVLQELDGLEGRRSVSQVHGSKASFAASDHGPSYQEDGPAMYVRPPKLVWLLRESIELKESRKVLKRSRTDCAVSPHPLTAADFSFAPINWQPLRGFNISQFARLTLMLNVFCKKTASTSNDDECDLPRNNHIQTR